jgi:pyridoxal phosphate enzyme (YggS family)
MEKIIKYRCILKNILDRVKESKFTKSTKFLTVTKKRSIDDIMSIYNEGHRDFGENYVPELIEKSLKLPEDINWHLIGHLQTNKCKKVLQIKNLRLIESVDSFKLAEELEKECIKLERTINILLQVNISKEETKSGVMPEKLVDLFGEILTLKYVKPVGIMSLGNIGNEDEFKQMFNLKNEICEKFNFNQDEFILSFGTSDDYETAILYGSNEVRIGGLIFDI